MEIAVLGGGNGSMAAALDLTEQGHSVRLWRRNRAAQAELRARDGSLTLKDIKGARPVQIGLVTDEIGAAVTGADLILCPTPAFAQQDIARALAPHLTDGQVIFLPPGSFGTWLMSQTLRDHGNHADLSWAEAGTLPYLTRRHGADTVAITTRATRLPTGVYPLKNADHAHRVLAQAFPAVEPAGDALSGALMNAGPIIHPPLILMNAGPIEHFDHWDIHNEGTQPAIRRVTTRLDSERIAIREALGYGAPHFPLAHHYDATAEEWMYGNMAHDRLVDSGDWREALVLTDHRYMREDVGVGLALLVSLADWAGVPAPTAHGLLALGSAICDTDFRSTGRTMQSLGLAATPPQTLQDQLKEGV